jgi:excinuclease UvrABC helicase subunit UvrB
MLGADGIDEEKVKKILKIEMTASPEELEEAIRDKKDDMKRAAENLLFETAALLRDELVELERELATKKTSSTGAKRQGARKKKDARA